MSSIWVQARTTPSSTSAASPLTRKKRVSRAVRTPTMPSTNQTLRAGCWSTWAIQLRTRTFFCRLSWLELSNLTRYFYCCTQNIINPSKYQNKLEKLFFAVFTFDVDFVTMKSYCDHYLQLSSLSKIQISWPFSSQEQPAECDLFLQF